MTVITDYLLRDINAYDWNLVTPVYTVRMISCADIQFTLHQIDTPIRFFLFFFIQFVGNVLEIYLGIIFVFTFAYNINMKFYF